MKHNQEEQKYLNPHMHISGIYELKKKQKIQKRYNMSGVKRETTERLAGLFE